MLTASWCVPSETAAARPLLTITESPLGTPHASLVPTRPRLTLPPRPLPFAQVKPEHVEAYRRNAPMYVDEEAERATRWDAFLAQKDDNGNDDDARDGARTLDALVRVLDARAARGSGDDALEESDEERELRSLVAGGVPMALRGRCWQIFARVKERRRDGWFRKLLIAAGETGETGETAATETTEHLSKDEGNGDEEDAVERALASLVDATCAAVPVDGRTAVPDRRIRRRAQLCRRILRFVASGNKSTRISREPSRGIAPGQHRARRPPPGSVRVRPSQPRGGVLPRHELSRRAALTVDGGAFYFNLLMGNYADVVFFNRRNPRFGAWARSSRTSCPGTTGTRCWRPRWTRRC